MMKPPPFKVVVKSLCYLFGLLRPVYPWMIFIILINFIGTLATIPFMDFGRVLGDWFGPREMSVWNWIEKSGLNSEPLFIYFTAAALLAVFAGICLMSAGFVSSKSKEFLLRSFQERIFKNIRSMNMQEVNARGAGDFVQGMNRDVFQVIDFFDTFIVGTLPELILASVYYIIMLSIDVKLTLIITVCLLLIIPTLRLCNRKVAVLARDLRNYGVDKSDQLIETIGGYRDIVVAGRFDKFKEKFSRLLRAAERDTVKTAFWGLLGGASTTVITNLILLVPIFYFVPDLLAAQETDPEKVFVLTGMTVSYIVFLQKFQSVFPKLYFLIQDFSMSGPSVLSVQHLIQDKTGMKESNEEFSGKVDSVSFKDVSFSYGPKPVLEDLNFEIPTNKITAIIGQSGSGKTTLFNLLLNLLEPQQGEIFVNGISISDFSEKDLSRIIGLVPQNPFIFNTSLRENILLGVDHECSEEEINRALKLSHLEEMIENKAAEGGLDSSAGYMGSALSAGQKQRLAVARLILQNPQVIVCDEYTANLDVQTAKYINDMMRTEFADRTRVIITHQLFTVKDADNFIVLDQGRVVQQGSYDELIEQEGLFKQLWNLQSLAHE